MYEKVNPAHSDKVADRIAGAIVDLAYAKEKDPRIAVEVLLGHGICHIMAETSVHFTSDEISRIVQRIAPELMTDYLEVKQDPILAKNQSGRIRCGDNGIFKGVPVTDEQKRLTAIAKQFYFAFEKDGKYILDLSAEQAGGDRLIICQSNADTENLRKMFPAANINPLGDWTGGSDVDCGATNRKLGSDMGDSVTGGGLHGNDLSKADVSVNIYAFLEAQARQETVEISCAIGDETVDGKPYTDIVEIARKYIHDIGGFEKFAEWGLIR